MVDEEGEREEKYREGTLGKEKESRPCEGLGNYK